MSRPTSSASAVSLVPGPLARRYVVLPFGFEDGKLLLAMADPANFLAIEDVRAVTQTDVKPCVATRSDVLAAIDLHRRKRISFWDALILQSAHHLRCRTIWSEDLNAGQVFGAIRVRNPFA